MINALTGLIGRLRIRTANEMLVQMISKRGNPERATMQSPPHHAANAEAISRPLELITDDTKKTIGVSATNAPRSGSLFGW